MTRLTRVQPQRRRLLLAGTALACGAPLPTWAQSAAQPLRIAVPQAPWYSSFERLTTVFERVNAAKVAFDVSPFTGLLEKTRPAMRAAASQLCFINCLPARGHNGRAKRLLTILRAT